MGKYSGPSSQRESSVSKPKQPHEVWRGIGCLMALIVPAISIAAGYETVKYVLVNKLGIIPYQLLGTPRLPDIVYRSTGLQSILEPLTHIPNLYANAIVSLLYMVLISGVVSVIYAATYNVVGPDRYGPTDAPPPKYKATKKSR